MVEKSDYDGYSDSMELGGFILNLESDLRFLAWKSLMLPRKRR